MNARPQIDEEIHFETGNRPQIADGIYLARYTHHETGFCFGTAKVYLWFKIVSPGSCFDVSVYRAYRAIKIKGKPKRNGGFTVKRGSDLYLDLVRLLDMRTRPDRVSATALAGKAYSIKTRTVTKDYRQRALPEWDRYSVVDSIVRAETSN